MSIFTPTAHAGTVERRDGGGKAAILKRTVRKGTGVVAEPAEPSGGGREGGDAPVGDVPVRRLGSVTWRSIALHPGREDERRQAEDDRKPVG
jgi:hypothetical protein